MHYLISYFTNSSWKLVLFFPFFFACIINKISSLIKYSLIFHIIQIHMHYLILQNKFSNTSKFSLSVFHMHFRYFSNQKLIYFSYHSIRMHYHPSHILKLNFKNIKTFLFRFLHWQFFPKMQNHLSYTYKLLHISTSLYSGILKYPFYSSKNIFVPETVITWTKKFLIIS